MNPSSCSGLTNLLRSLLDCSYIGQLLNSAIGMPILFFFRITSERNSLKMKYILLMQDCHIIKWTYEIIYIFYVILMSHEELSPYLPIHFLSIFVTGYLFQVLEFMDLWFPEVENTTSSKNTWGTRTSTARSCGK